MFSFWCNICSVVAVVTTATDIMTWYVSRTFIASTFLIAGFGAQITVQSNAQRLDRVESDVRDNRMAVRELTTELAKMRIEITKAITEHNQELKSLRRELGTYTKEVASAAEGAGYYARPVTLIDLMTFIAALLGGGYGVRFYDRRWGPNSRTKEDAG